ncbi:MAG: response regulator transcription factor [Lachnospiraceae bacterium]|nr:response regulator transcription factor [Lachnospiraceae bacterium]
MRILLAEDEESLSEALAMILRRNGYEVQTAGDGLQAMEYLERGSYDAVILDIMMPKADGITVLKTRREKGNLTPVLMLTAKSEVEDKVTGLEAGANDYLTKPFHSRELMARIKAITRAQAYQDHPRVSCSNVTLDRETLEISTPAGALQLARKEFQMLELLVSTPGGQVDAERFLEKLWGNDGDTEPGIVPMYVSYLQRKLKFLHADIWIEEATPGTYSLRLENEQRIGRNF